MSDPTLSQQLDKISLDAGRVKHLAVELANTVFGQPAATLFALIEEISERIEKASSRIADEVGPLEKRPVSKRTVKR